MKMSGKAITVFLLALAILSLCLTSLTLFLFRQEKEKRLSLEQQLEQLSNTRKILEEQLSEAKKQAFLFQEKLKESESKIVNLIDERDAIMKQNEELRSGNNNLTDSLKNASEENEQTNMRLTQANEQIKNLQEQINQLEKTKTDLEEKLKTTASSSEVQLEKIVVTPQQPNEGRILTINKEHSFVIINLSAGDGINIDDILSVYDEKNKYLGDIKIERLEQTMSVANFISPLNPDKVKEGYKVVIKE